MMSFTYARVRIWSHFFALGLAALLTLGGLSGCVHRINIQQGNFLDSEDIDRVAVGMTRVQVRALLGTPMVADPFVSNRWDYVYYLKLGHWNEPQRRHFIVYFDPTDKVERVDRETEKGAVKTASTPTDRTTN
jgi:outer membrane protein assembly factor BamE